MVYTRQATGNHPQPMVTTTNCFNSSEFRNFYQQVVDTAENAAIGPEYPACFIWDDGFMLELIVELFNESCPVPDAAQEALEAYETGQVEAWMEIPSWA